MIKRDLEQPGNKIRTYAGKSIRCKCFIKSCKLDAWNRFSCEESQKSINKTKMRLIIPQINWFVQFSMLFSAADDCLIKISWQNKLVCDLDYNPITNHQLFQAVYYECHYISTLRVITEPCKFRLSNNFESIQSVDDSRSGLLVTGITTQRNSRKELSLQVSQTIVSLGNCRASNWASVKQAPCCLKRGDEKTRSGESQDYDHTYFHYDHTNGWTLCGQGDQGISYTLDSNTVFVKGNFCWRSSSKTTVEQQNSARC